MLDISFLSLDQTIKALIMGRELDVGSGTPYILDEDARRALHFLYASDEKYLTKPKGKGEQALQLLTWMQKDDHDPVVLEEISDGSEKKEYRLKKAKFYQVGGLQPFCLDDGSLPVPIEIDFEKPVFLAQGDNGAGKSRFVNMLTFGLTGKIPRDTSEPLHWNEAVLKSQYTFENETTCELPPFIPVPSLAQWEAASVTDGPIIQSGVELVLEPTSNPDGEEVSIKRLIKRQAAKDKDEEFLYVDDQEISPSQLANTLGISDVALELSALHLARLKQIRFGQKGELLSDRVAELTGLRPLADILETQAGRKGVVKTFIDNLDNGTLLKKWKGEGATKGVYGLKQIEAAFNEIIETCRKDCEENQVSFSLPSSPLLVDNGKRCAAGLETFKSELATEEERIKQVVSDSSGLDINADLDTLSQLAQNLMYKLTYDQVYGDGFAAFIQKCEGLSDEDITSIKVKFDQAVQEVNAFAERVSDQKKAARQRLYAKVAVWFKEEGADAEEIDDCPVCFRSFDDSIVDPNLDNIPVQAALEEARNLDDLDKTVDDFTQKKFMEVAALIPFCAQWKSDYHQKASEAAVYDLIRDNILNFITKNTPESLKPILATPFETFTSRMGELPPVENERRIFHQGIPQNIQAGAQRLSDLLTLIDWARGTVETRTSLYQQSFGEVPSQLTGADDDSGESMLSPECLVHKLNELIILIQNNYSVLKRLKDQFVKLDKEKGNWDYYHGLISVAPDVVTALKKLLELKTGVIDAQVTGLMVKLTEETKTHYSNFYHMRGELHPKVQTILHDGNGIAVTAEVNKTIGSALDITNSSRMRVYLFSFLYALAEFVWNKSGGIKMMAMDDPQILFDELNQKNLAKGIVKLGKGEGKRGAIQSVIFTYDKAFASFVARSGGESLNHTVKQNIQYIKIQPRSEYSVNVDLRPHSDMLRKARQDWSNDKNDQRKIIYLCAEARKYLEEAIGTFLSLRGKTTTGSETLQELIKMFSPLMKAENSVLNQQCFKSFMSYIPQGQDDEDTELFAQAINWSAHARDQDLRVEHAVIVEEKLDGIIQIRNTCDEALSNAYIMPRIENQPTLKQKQAIANAQVIQLQHHQPAPFQLLEMGQVAASMSEQSAGQAEIGGTPQPFDVEVDALNTFVLGNAPNKSLPAYVPPGTILFAQSEAAFKLNKGDLIIARCSDTGRLAIGQYFMKNEKGLAVIQGFENMPPVLFEMATSTFYRCCGGVYGAVADVSKVPLHQMDCQHFLEPSYLNCTITSGQSAEPFLSTEDRILVNENRLTEAEIANANDLVAVIYLENGERQLKRLNKTNIAGCVSFAPLGTYGEAGLFAFNPQAPDEIAKIEQAYEMKGFWKGSSFLASSEA